MDSLSLFFLNQAHQLYLNTELYQSQKILVCLTFFRVFLQYILFEGVFANIIFKAHVSVGTFFNGQIALLYCYWWTFFDRSVTINSIVAAKGKE